MDILLIVAAMVPGVLVVLLIYFLDKYEKEGTFPIIVCFLLGILCTVPILELNKTEVSRFFDKPKEILPTLFYAFVYIAAFEEVLKLIVLLLYPYRRSFFNEPFDGILYAVAIAMGFATVENFLYASAQRLDIVFLRTFTAVPAHAAFAVLQGYFVGKSKFNSSKRFNLISMGLLFSIIAHGLYDFFILQEAFQGLIIFAFITLSVSIYLAIRLIKLHQDDSPFKMEEQKETKTDSKQ